MADKDTHSRDDDVRYLTQTRSEAGASRPLIVAVPRGEFRASHAMSVAIIQATGVSMEVRRDGRDLHSDVVLGIDGLVAPGQLKFALPDGGSAVPLDAEGRPCGLAGLVWAHYAPAVIQRYIYRESVLSAAGGRLRDVPLSATYIHLTRFVDRGLISAIDDTADDHSRYPLSWGCVIRLMRPRPWQMGETPDRARHQADDPAYGVAIEMSARLLSAHLALAVQDAIQRTPSGQPDGVTRW